MINILCSIDEVSPSGAKTGGQVKVMSTGSEDYIMIEVVDSSGQFASVKIAPKDLILATEHARDCIHNNS